MIETCKVLPCSDGYRGETPLSSHVRNLGECERHTMLNGLVTTDEGISNTQQKRQRGVVFRVARSLFDGGEGYAI